MKTIRDIFHENGLNYSQVVGEEDTVVSMGLDGFNQALKEIEEVILDSLPTEYKYPDSEYEQYYHEGWNSYLEHTHKAIKRVIGGK